MVFGITSFIKYIVYMIIFYNFYNVIFPNVTYLVNITEFQINT